MPAAAWLLPMFGSSLSFAFADVLCDVVILEADEDEDSNDGDDRGEETPDHESADGSGERTNESQPVVLRRNGTTERMPKSAGGGSLPASPRKSTMAATSPRTGPEGAVLQMVAGLSGEQDTAMAGFVNLAGLISVGSYWYLRALNVDVAMLDKEVGSMPGGATGTAAPGVDLSQAFVWGPTTHVEFWAAIAGGVLTFSHYFLLLKAFEGASSTVLLPLVQVASVATLLGSAGISMFRHEAWITWRHLSAYALLFVGGILPACDGHLQALLRWQFWKQPFVWCTILSELTLGAHDLMLNACSYHGTAPGRPEGEAEAEVPEGQVALSDSFQFFFYSRVAFCATFACLFMCNARLFAQLQALLLGTVPLRFILLSLLSEGLTILGFYLASIAYSLFYQAAIVHAAEASMSQLLNLLVAFCLQHLCSIGRESAAKGVKTKLVSFVLVTGGLFLCGEDGQGVRRR
mmetsp:Transcript_3245/g.9364  ORF Transcript_3245/g.9364 Transcript_3245/m.9364 type:complete len:462 (+) Transcript_3245:97-1482(+)